MTQNEAKKSGLSWVALSLFSVLILGAAGVAYLYLPELMPKQSTDIVLIKGEEGPFKSKPEEPGGQIVTNQESKVMQMLGELNPSTGAVETLLAPSSAPELPPVSVAEATTEALPDAKTDDAPKTVPEETLTEPASKIAKPGIPATEPKTIIAKPKTVVVEPEVTEDTKKQDTGNKGDAGDTEVASDTEVVSDTEVASDTNVAGGEAAPITETRVEVDPNEPTYMIQLAAFRKSDVASEQAGLLLKKHEKRLQGATLGTMRIDTGENGVFWRVVSEPLPRAAADTICASLKRSGQDCILRKFTAAAP